MNTLILVLMAFGVPSQAFRAKPPPPLARVPLFKPAPPQIGKLASGTRLLVGENHLLPWVAIDVMFPAGTNRVPRGKAGLADITALLLLEGTDKQTASAIADARDALGLQLRVTVQPDGARVQMECGKEVLPEAIALLIESIATPAFVKEDIDRVQRLALSALEAKRGDAAALAANLAYRTTFGAQHPWGQPIGGSVDSVARLSATDMKAFHRNWYALSGASIAVVGDITLDEVSALMVAALPKANAASSVSASMPPLAPRAIGMTLVDIPSATQSQIWVAMPLFEMANADAVAFELAHRVLGGMFSSRLNMDLRERRGLSYGVRSTATTLSSAGMFTISGGYEASKTAEAVAALKQALASFSRGDVTEAELAGARAHYLQWVPGQLSTMGEVATAYNTMVQRQLPLEFWTTLTERVAATTLADVNRVAKRWVRADAPIVIVGPAAKYEQTLSATYGGLERLLLSDALSSD